ncbi:MAG: uracil-DNA glycosylase [Bacilli bacterium]|nr:uracil-DNA glycosylase [Bacilli bacterium]
MIGNNWDKILEEEYHKEYFLELINKVNNEYRNKIIFPEYKNIFNAFKLTPYEVVKVVIIGQDPYHGEKEAHGLSFSVLEGVARPPSLNNIFKELYSDLGIKKESNDLTNWAKEGVMLLNSILTVEKDKPLSHKDFGWTYFTDSVIKKINEKTEPVIFILWGNYARSKKELITNKIHYIIESAHPSPLSASRGFLGSKPFSKTNKILKELGKKEINWE